MTRQLFPIIAITFVDVLGFTILIPLLPYYAEHFGAVPIVVGSIVTTVAFVGLIAAPIWGRISDRIGRKKVLLYSQCFGVISYLMLGIGGSLAMIFAARAVEGIASANLGVTQAYVSDLTEPKNRARAFGLLGATFGSGFVLGPALGSVLSHIAIALPFYVAAAMQLCTIVLTIMVLPESHAPLDKPPTLAAITTSLAIPTVRNILIQQLVFALSFTMWVTVFALFVERVLGFGAEQTALLYVIPGAIAVVVQLTLIGKLVDRFGERNIAILGLGFGVVGMALVGLVTSVWLLLVTLVLWSFAGALVRPTIGSLVSQAAPDDQRGTILGVSDSLNSLAFVIGPLVSTTILTYNVHAVGILPALCGIIAIIIGLGTPRFARDDAEAIPA